MPDRQDQHDILGGQPTVFCDVAIPAARQYEFAPPFLRHATQQWMIRENLECGPQARNQGYRLPGINIGDEVEQSLQVTQRPNAYFDARHERARGRRGLLPATLAAR